MRPLHESLLAGTYTSSVSDMVTADFTPEEKDKEPGEVQQWDCASTTK